MSLQGRMQSSVKGSKVPAITIIDDDNKEPTVEDRMNEAQHVLPKRKRNA